MIIFQWFTAHSTWKKKIFKAGSACTNPSVSCRDCLVYGLSPGQPSTVHLAWRFESSTISFKKENKCVHSSKLLFRCLKEFDPYGLSRMAQLPLSPYPLRFFPGKLYLYNCCNVPKGPLSKSECGLQSENPIDYPQSRCILRVMLETYVRTYFLSRLVLFQSESFSKWTGFLSES